MAPPSPSMRACQNSTNLPPMVSKAGTADLVKWFGSHRPRSTVSRSGHVGGLGPQLELEIALSLRVRCSKPFWVRYGREGDCDKDTQGIKEWS